MTQAPDAVPVDEVLEIIRDSEIGVTAGTLLDMLREQGYEELDVIRAIQRLFDRGLVELGSELALVEAPEREAVAA